MQPDAAHLLGSRHRARKKRVTVGARTDLRMDDDVVCAIRLQGAHIIVGAVERDGVGLSRYAVSMGDLGCSIGKMDGRLALGHRALVIGLLLVGDDDIDLARDRGRCGEGVAYGEESPCKRQSPEKCDGDGKKNGERECAPSCARGCPSSSRSLSRWSRHGVRGGDHLLLPARERAAQDRRS